MSDLMFCLQTIFLLELSGLLSAAAEAPTSC
jgi:hypothetical protein